MIRPGHARILLAIALLIPAGCVETKFGRHDTRSDENRELPTVGTRKVEIKTDNGYVQVRPASEGDESITVRAIIRATANNAAEAQECLQSVEITTPVVGADESTQQISWAWREPHPRPSWDVNVSFEVKMPPHLALDVSTTNGQIDVVGITGDCQVHTENGSVRAVAGTHKLKAESTNGTITVDTPADEVKLITTNGRVRGVLSNESQIAGSIHTENGSIELEIATTAAADIECRTANGRIRNKLQLDDVEKNGQSRLTGKLSGGGETLKIEAQNGTIELKGYGAPSNDSSRARKRNRDRDD